MRTTNAIRLAYVADAVGRASEMSTMSETGNQMGFPIARKVGPAFVAMEPYHAENLTAGSRGNTSTRRQRPRRRNLAAKQIPLRLGSRWHFIPIPKTARADGARATHFVPSGPNPYSVAFVPSTLSAPKCPWARFSIGVRNVRRILWMRVGRTRHLYRLSNTPQTAPNCPSRRPLAQKFGGNLSNV